MKRLTTVVLAAALVALAPSAADAAKKEKIRVTCADVVGGSVAYTVEPGLLPPLTTTRSVASSTDLAAPSCPGVTYTLHVLDGDGSTTELDGVTYDTGPATEIATISRSGDGSNPITHSASVEDDDAWVCAYLETSVDGAVVDRAPDTGCLLAGENGLGGSGGSGVWK